MWQVESRARSPMTASKGRSGKANSEQTAEQLIIDNARRLAADARLLSENERFASAFALAVLGLEEVGKLLFRRWQSDEEFCKLTKKYSAHRIKQAIVSSIYLADITRTTVNQYLDENGYVLYPKELTEEEIKRIAPPLGENESLVERLSSDFHNSYHSRLIDFARFGVIDKTKQWALYVDDENICHNMLPSNFSSTGCVKMIERIENAIDLYNEEFLEPIAKAIFVNVFANKK